MIKAGPVIMCALSISGCGHSYFTSRESNPVIEDHSATNFWDQHHSVVFATTASRRLAIMTEDQRETTHNILTCAEPSPDVGESFSSAIAAGLKAAASGTPPSGTPISAELAAQYGRSVATQIAPLLYRTQGLQLYRDAIYKLCIDRMNGWIATDEAYEKERKEKFVEAIKLIIAEFPIMQETAKTYYMNVKAGDSKVNVDDVAKIIELLKKAGMSPGAGVDKKQEAPTPDKKAGMSAGAGVDKKQEAPTPDTFSIDDILKIIEALKK
jgi:hypothetical protein